MNNPNTPACNHGAKEGVSCLACQRKKAQRKAALERIRKNAKKLDW
jgi:hypothetical protein